MFVEQLHSRGVFWRIRGGPPGGAAGGARRRWAVGSWHRGTDNPHDVVFWRIRQEVDIKELRKRLLGAAGSLVSLHVSLPTDSAADAADVAGAQPPRRALRVVVLQREVPSKKILAKELPVTSGAACLTSQAGMVDGMCRTIKSVQTQLAAIKERSAALEVCSEQLLADVGQAQAVAARASEDAVQAYSHLTAQSSRSTQLAAQVCHASMRSMRVRVQAARDRRNDGRTGGTVGAR